MMSRQFGEGHYNSERALDDVFTAVVTPRHHKKTARFTSDKGASSKGRANGPLMTQMQRVAADWARVACV
jgi:hypothetical protein